MTRRFWLVAVLIVTIIALPWVIDLRPNSLDLLEVLQPPSRNHWLGTDENGRDVLSRLLAGGQATLGIGLAGAALAVAIGSVFGAMAGSAGGWVDDVIMRATDLALALPTLFVILIFSTIVRPGVVQIMLLIGLTGWMPVCRVVRGAARELATREFVEAAYAAGAGRWRIVRNHILPNLQNIIGVTVTLQLSRAIMTEATISFLGAGIQPPDATWGTMLSGAQSYLLIAPWLALAPGIALSFTLLAVAGVSFGLQDLRRISLH